MATDGVAALVARIERQQLSEGGRGSAGSGPGAASPAGPAPVAAAAAGAAAAVGTSAAATGTAAGNPSVSGHQQQQQQQQGWAATGQASPSPPPRPGSRGSERSHPSSRHHSRHHARPPPGSGGRPSASPAARPPSASAAAARSGRPPSRARSSPGGAAARHSRSATLADSSDLDDSTDTSDISQSDSSGAMSDTGGGSNARSGDDGATSALQAGAGAAAADGGAGGGSSSSGPASAAARALAVKRLNGDPDYEVPEGRLTETQVFLSRGEDLAVDRYGFIVAPEEARARAAAARVRRTRAQQKKDARAVAKWRKMLGSGREDFVAYMERRPAKVKRRVRKGIPDEFRGLVWQYLSGGRALMAAHPALYASLLATPNEAVDMEIMRDLNRTFPNHVLFSQRQGPGQRCLFHVLRAFSAWDQRVGYVQGMGFVAAVLLMYMSEEEAFWTLAALVKGEVHAPLEGLYTPGMPLLRLCLAQFTALLRQELPRLGSHMAAEGVEASMYCTHWFNTVFAYSLPFEHLLRVWDVFLLEGMKTVFRVGLALLASAADELTDAPFERLVSRLNARKFPVLRRPPDSLMRSALRISVSKRLRQLRDEYERENGPVTSIAGSASSGNSSGHGGGENGGGGGSSRAAG